MKVTVDGERCVGSGQCVDFAPQVFDQDENGTAFTLTDAPQPDDEAQVREAWNSCPVMAIEIVDAE